MDFLEYMQNSLCYEQKVYYLFRNDTVENVERKQARTEGERQESDGEMSEEEADEDDDDDIPYNPKVSKLPSRTVQLRNIRQRNVLDS